MLGVLLDLIRQQLLEAGFRQLRRCDSCSRGSIDLHEAASSYCRACTTHSQGIIVCHDPRKHVQGKALPEFLSVADPAVTLSRETKKRLTSEPSWVPVSDRMVQEKQQRLPMGNRQQ